MTDKHQTLTPVVICMGSQSDWPTMQAAENMLDALDVCYDVLIISAHRTPDRLTAFAKSARTNGIQVISLGQVGLRIYRHDRCPHNCSSLGSTY